MIKKNIFILSKITPIIRSLPSPLSTTTAKKSKFIDKKSQTTEREGEGQYRERANQLTLFKGDNKRSLCTGLHLIQ